MMRGPGYVPYLPQCEPKQLDDELWVVDGPEVDYRFAGLTLPCPTRMTIVRIDSGLWLHSPSTYSVALGEQIATFGQVRWIVAPNSFHHTHVAGWAAAYPTAECHVSPDLVPRFASLAGPVQALGVDAPPDWQSVFEQLQVDLGGFIETIFLHRPTGTLIVTDLMQNFEADRIVNPITRLILRAGGSIGPRGGTSIDIRLPARRHRDRVQAAAARMRQWAPRRIVLSHGKCYDADIDAELEQAFRWAQR